MSQGRPRDEARGSTGTILETCVQLRHARMKLGFLRRVAPTALSLMLPIGAAAQTYAGAGCTASMENRASTVDSDGVYNIPNVPAAQGKYKVHVVCPQPDGTLLDAYSGFYDLSGAPAYIPVPLLALDVPRPQPQSLRISPLTGALSAVGATVQLAVVLYDPTGSPSDGTLASEGTTYVSSSNSVATVSPDGLVTATGAGSLTITALNNGLVGTIQLNSFAQLDTVGDGIPDAWKIANGLDPYDPTVAGQDPDGDGLTNLQEYQLGTNPHVADTDGDGLTDGQEVALGTNPLVADTDGDGLSDGQEQALGTNPLLADTDGDGIPDGIEVKIGTNPLVADVTTTVTGYVSNSDGTPSVGTSTVVLTYFNALTDSTGNYTILTVPITLGNLSSTAEVVIGGKVYSGSSPSTVPVGNGVTKLGTIVLGQNGGQVTGMVTTPDKKPDAGVQVIVSGGADTRSAVTDSNGLYAVSGLQAGPVAVAAIDPATSLRGQAAGILSGGVSLTLNVQLGSLGTVSGIVTDTTGRPVGAGISVAITGALAATTQTDGVGHYSFAFVPLGAVTVDATDTKGNHGRSQGVVTATAQTLTENVQYLGQGTVNGVVSDGTGAPVSGVNVSLTNGGVLYQGLTTATNSVGQYSFSGVFIGPLTISANSPLTSTGARTTAALNTNGQVVTANITLQPTATVTGTVYRVDGTTTVPGALVQVLGNGIPTTASTAGVYIIPYVPLGNYTLLASDPASNDRGEAAVSLPTAGQTVTVAVDMVGLGTLKVTVVDGGGNPSAGSAVQVSSGGPFNQSQVGVSASDGTVSFTQVISNANIQISATNPATGLGGEVNVALTAGQTVSTTVTLQSSGTVQGTVFQHDGQTPVSGVTVTITSGSQTQSTLSAANGTYSFTNVPSGNLNIAVKDSIGNTLSFSNDLTLTTQGQVVTANFVIVGRGTVQGTVTFPDGSFASGVAVQIQSSVAGASVPYGVATDINGFYSIPQVPVGAYNVTAQQHTITSNSYGSVGGTLPADGSTVTTNVMLSSSLVPATLVLTDANGLQYQVRETGAIVNGSFGVFDGDNNANQGGSLLSLLQNGKATPFTGEDFAPVDLGARQISITQNGVDGLNVTRRVYVPVDGYFARYVELLSNPGASPVTVGLQLTTNFAQEPQFNLVNGIFDYFTNIPQIVQTSSGDQILNVNDPNTPDYWVTLGESGDHDPFLPQATSDFGSTPAVAEIFDGPGGAIKPSSAAYAADSSNLFATLLHTYSSITVPAGGTVAFLHYVSQENHWASANAAATRLVQLPPEAIAGLSQADLASIANFAVPSGGVSAVPALPSITNQISGQVYAYDGSTPIPFATVHLTSSDPIYARTYIATATIQGEYNFQGSLGGLAIPNENFSVVAWDSVNITPVTASCRTNALFQGPGCAILSPSFPGSFTTNSPTFDSVPVSFTNTGIITGTISRGPVVLNAAGTVTLSGGPMLSVSTNIQPDGTYTFLDVLPGTYNILASVTNTLLTGLASTAVGAGATTTTNITIIGSGNVTGLVTRPDGSLAIGDSVNLRIPGQNALTSVVDTSGHYAFTDVPIGSAEVDCFDPSSNTAANATITVTGNASVTQNLPLQSAGSVSGIVTVNDGSSVAGLNVTLTATTSTGTENLSTTTNATGSFTFNNVTPGTIVLRATNSEGLQGTGNGSLPLAGQTVTINIALIAAGSLQGVVYQGDGMTPAAGIQLTLSPAPLTGNAVTTSAANGTYSYSNVALGNFTVYASNKANGDQGYAYGQIQAINQQRTVNVTLNGFGNLTIKLLNTSGNPVVGGSVVVTTQNFSSTNTGITDANGNAQFNNVYAGPFSVVGKDPVSGYSVRSSGTVTYNGNSSLTLTLQALATLQGIVYSPDGVTPAPGVTVYIVGQTDKSTSTGTDGSYQFASIPVGYYNISVQDASGTTRAVVNGIQLQTSGSVLTQNLTLVGIGSVSGTVLNEDGSVAENLSLTLTSANTSFGGARGTTTGGDGTYTFSEVPVGKFTVAVNYLPSGMVGYGSGSISANLGSAVVNIQIQGNAITLPVTLTDADGFGYPILASGEFSGNGYYGGLTPFVNSQPLNVTVGGTLVQFGQVAPAAIQSLNGQQIELTEPVNGLNVTRKIYVPSTGYFARRLDVLQNPTSSPITVSVAIGDSSNYDREIKNGLPVVVTTSNGNKTVDNSILWEVDDDDDGTRPYPRTQPAMAEVFEGVGAPTTLASVTNSINSYTTGYGGNGSNIYSEGYEAWVYTYQSVTIPANSQVSFLFFTALEATQGTAETAAQRLVQLPPEALSGLSAADLASIVNFVVPTAQNLSPINPPATGTLSGHVYAYDAATPVPKAVVYAQSTDLQYGGGATVAADTNGAYTLPPFPFNTYAVEAVDPLDNVTSTMTTGTLVSGATTQTQDIPFIGTGILQGIVQPTGNTVITSGIVSAYFCAGANSTGCGYGNFYLVPPSNAFSFLTIPQSNVNINANIYTSAAGGFYLTQGTYVSANQTANVVLTLPPTGNVTGTITNADGTPASGATISASPMSGGTYETTTSASDGTYTFTGLGLATYTIQANDPITKTSVSQTTVVTQDTTSTVNLQFIGKGTVNVTLKYANGNIGQSATVSIYVSTGNGNAYGNCQTDNNGQCSFTNIPDGTFTLRAYYPGQSFYSTTTGSMTGNAQTVPISATLTPVGTISGSLTYSNNTPAPGNYVNARDIASIYGGAAITDSAGNYAISPVPADRLINVFSYNTANNNTNRTIEAVANNQQLGGDGQTLTVNLRYPGLATVHVTALHNDGTPYASGQIYIKSADGTQSYSSSMGSDGSATFTNVIEGSFFGAFQSGTSFNSGSTTFTVPPSADGTTVQVNIQTSPTGTVQGQVYAADGKTLIIGNDVHVALTDSLTGNVNSTDETTGSYSFSNVQESSSGFTIGAELYNSPSTLKTATANIMTDGQVVVQNFTLPVSSVSGIVYLNDGVTPVPNANVNGLQMINGTSTYFDTTADADGNYQLVGALMGPLVITAYDSNSVVGTATISLSANASILTGANVSLGPVGTVMGTVYDANGSLVTFNGIEIDSSGNNGGFSTYAYTDANGNYSVSDVPTGNITVTVYLSNEVSETGTGVLNSNGDVVTVIVGNAPVVPSGQIFGTVYDSNQNPAPGAAVSATASSSGQVFTTTTDDNGVYTLSGLPLGDVTVSAILSDGSSSGATTGTVAMVNTPVEIDLGLQSPGNISGVVTDSSGNPIMNATLYVFNNADNFIEEVNTDSNGYYLTSGPSPGPITVQLLDSNQNPDGSYNVLATANGTLPYGGNVTINVTLPMVSSQNVKLQIGKSNGALSPVAGQQWPMTQVGNLGRGHTTATSLNKAPVRNARTIASGRRTAPFHAAMVQPRAVEGMIR